MTYTETDILEMLKALSNPTRLQIMQWLSDPETELAGLSESGTPSLPGWGGACVSTIQRKAGISQSVMSGYLRSMQQAGLLEAQRHEKWTYYRINGEAVRALSAFIAAWDV